MFQTAKVKEYYSSDENPEKEIKKKVVEINTQRNTNKNIFEESFTYNYINKDNLGKPLSYICEHGVLSSDNFFTDKKYSNRRSMRYFSSPELEENYYSMLDLKEKTWPEHIRQENYKVIEFISSKRNKFFNLIDSEEIEYKDDYLNDIEDINDLCILFPGEKKVVINNKPIIIDHISEFKEDITPSYPQLISKNTEENNKPRTLLQNKRSRNFNFKADFIPLDEIKYELTTGFEACQKLYKNFIKEIDNIKNIIKRCFMCNSKWHKANNCTDKAGNVSCTKCKKFGHLAEGCLLSPKEIETNEPVTDKGQIKKKKFYVPITDIITNNSLKERETCGNLENKFKHYTYTLNTDCSYTLSVSSDIIINLIE